MKFLGKIFNSGGHLLAWLLNKAFPVAETAVKDGAVIEQAVQQALSPVAPDVARKMQAVTGDVLNSYGAVLQTGADAAAVIASKGLNVAFDLKTIQDIHELYVMLSGLFGKAPEPAATPQAA